MYKTILSLLSLFILMSACKSADKKASEATQTQSQAQVEKKSEPAVEPAQTGALPKWPADYPVTGDSVAVLTISQEGVGELGEIVLEFYPDKAPNHVRNFKYLANNKFYDGTKFHRVIKGFMIQGGDPNSKDANPANDGQGGPGWQVNAEFNPTSHKKGILSMARSSDPNSAGSQFFICHGDPAHLNNQYTVFGNTIKGLDVVDKIANTPIGNPQMTSPAKAVTITSCRIVPRSSVKL